MTPMLDCESVMRQLWDYLDLELTADRMAAIREHLELCTRCQPLEQFERAFLDAVARARSEHPDPDALGIRVRSALRAQGYQHA
ncbi:MAG: zf-HC2 domain-containing protein [Gemmatimonadaceae bacterium]